MPIIVGGVAAMIALAAGILGRVDPFASLERALLAFVLGWIGGQVWHVIVTVQGLGSRSAGNAGSTGSAGGDPPRK